MKITTCTEGSSRAVKFFQEIFDSFKPVKKFTSFFDNANFLLTDYKPSNSDVHTIIENFRGDIIEFTSLNCGYRGQGPGGTARVLQIIGLKQETALELREYNTIKIDFDGQKNNYQHCFDKDGENKEYITDYSLDMTTFFNCRVRAKEFQGCNIDENTVVNILTRDVYMINPEIHNLNGLLHCLHIMKPVEFEYVIGKKLYFIQVDEIPELSKTNVPVQLRHTRGVNLIIRGEKFDIKCLIGEKTLQGTLNCIYTYLMKANLFEECPIGDTYVNGKPNSSGLFNWWKTLFLMLRSPHTIHHQILDVNDKELKRNV